MNRTYAVSITTAAIALASLTGARAADPTPDAAQAGVEVQAGFYTPTKRGELWDCWAYYHEGKYYQYYLAGPYAAWVGHDLAISDDGVHWKQHGRIVAPRRREDAGQRASLEIAGFQDQWQMGGELFRVGWAA